MTAYLPPPLLNLFKANPDLKFIDPIDEERHDRYMPSLQTWAGLRVVHACVCAPLALGVAPLLMLRGRKCLAWLARSAAAVGP